MCIFEAAKTGKNQFWMVQTSPSVWKLRKWIRAWRKLLVLGSCMWGRLPRPTRPLSAQHALSLRKQSNTKWEKLKCVKYVETILKYFFTASNPFRFVANLCSGSHQRNFQRPERGATSSQDESPPGLCFSKFRTQKNCKTMDWVDYLDNLKL